MGKARTVSIYVLRASDGGPVVYVGQTTRLEQRRRQHESGKQGSRGLRAWVAEVKARGATVSLKVVQRVDPLDAGRAEGWWQRKYLADGCKLLNVVINPAPPLPPEPRRLSVAEMHARHPNWTQYAPPILEPKLNQRPE
jgi:hypothetical protein